MRPDLLPSISPDHPIRANPQRRRCLPHAHSQQGNNRVNSSTRFFTQHRVVIVGKRMADHRERVILQSVHAAHRLRCTHETVSDNGDCRNAKALCFDGVVQTAR